MRSFHVILKEEYKEYKNALNIDELFDCFQNNERKNEKKDEQIPVKLENYLFK